MTTLIGMVAKGAIVIAADPQANVYDEEQLERTPPVAKISIGNHHALAFTGGIDDDYMPSLFEYLSADIPDFESYYKTQTGARPTNDVLEANFAYSRKLYNANQRLDSVLNARAKKVSDLEELCIKMISGKYTAKRPFERILYEFIKKVNTLTDPITRAVKAAHFYEIDVYNRGVIARGGDDDDTVEFLLATSKPELQLFKVGSYGGLFEVAKDKDRPFSYVTLGEGTDLAEGYVKKGLYAKDDNLPDHIEVGSRRIPKNKLRNLEPLPWQAAAWICVGAVTHASQLATTGQNPDVVVITDNAVHNLTDSIRTALREKKRDAYAGVFGELNLDNGADTDPEDEDQ